MRLAKTKAVRFPKVMTCLNIGCPLGNGIWEGVPLRDVLWMTRPQKDLRRVFYHGYHNDKPEQMFRSSLPVGRVLEDPFDLPPVILCYKLNGHFLSPERGGPVRVVVPEAYGFKSIKWLSHVYLSNIASANDTYADQNNDVDSPLKTFCATLSIPNEVKPNQPIPITGYAQVGISGLKKVQVWIQKVGEELPPEDQYFQTAPWIDAQILPAPDQWGGQLADNEIPSPTIGFDSQTGQPSSWPIRFSKAHWAILHPGLAEGDYVFRCRTIDEKGHPQPLPRPFRKSGRTAIERISIRVSS
jgi:DMSO/TMAO reductase YedYZ molybdopterin-dependent catalytic subunit